ncbi:MAG: hypothetical protein KIS77_13225 [Saprospiraceae bacterium]|nr:hypothetical protein [Saprospiraceae bacterium]
MSSVKYFHYPILDYTKYIETNSKNKPEAFLNRGIAKVKLEQISEACIDFQEAKKLGNNFAIDYIQKYCK